MILFLINHSEYKCIYCSKCNSLTIIAQLQMSYLYSIFFFYLLYFFQIDSLFTLKKKKKAIQWNASMLKDFAPIHLLPPNFLYCHVSFLAYPSRGEYLMTNTAFIFLFPVFLTKICFVFINSLVS